MLTVALEKWLTLDNPTNIKVHVIEEFILSYCRSGLGLRGWA